MTRDEDNKMGNAELGPYDRKVESRWDKQARALLGQDGRPRRLDKLHADDGGEHRC